MPCLFGLLVQCMSLCVLCVYVCMMFDSESEALSPTTLRLLFFSINSETRYVCVCVCVFDVCVYVFCGCVECMCLCVHVIVCFCLC